MYAIIINLIIYNAIYGMLINFEAVE